MRSPAVSPNRGLLAGLVALVAFASAAVALTAGGQSGASATTGQMPTAVRTATGRFGGVRDERDERGAFGRHGGRFR